MFRDFLDLIALLNKYKAKYLVIGGYAVGYHAQARATKDLDILILPAPKNAAAVFKALQEFGAPLRTKADPQDTDHFASRRALSAKDFEDEDSWFMMGPPPVAVDILAKIPGVVFNAAWKNRVTVMLDEEQGVTVQVISRDALIAAKLASGRSQDLADVEAIRAAAAEVAAMKLAKPDPPPKGKRKKPQPKF
jgi:Nucleotidyl transferase AbiEii toxin, Type IV TA system